MKAKYGAMLLAEMSFADEAQAAAADRKVLDSPAAQNPDAD